MTMARRLIALVAMLLASWLPLAAQDAARPGKADERDLQEAEKAFREAEARLRQAARRLEDLQHQRQGDQEINLRLGRFPWVSNRAALGIVLRTEAGEKSDAIGATIAAVTPGGAAEEAGLKAGDIVVAINGETLTGLYPSAAPDESAPAARLIDRAHGLEEGEKVTIEYRRGNEKRTVAVVARRMRPNIIALSLGPVAEALENLEDIEDLDVVEGIPAPPAAPAPVALPAPPAPPAPAALSHSSFLLQGYWMDMELVSLNPDLGSYFGAGKGVLVVRPPSDDSLKLRGGDVILKIGDEEPETPLQAVRALRAYDPGETITLGVVRKGERMTLTAVAPESSLIMSPRIRIRKHSRTPD